MSNACDDSVVEIGVIKHGPDPVRIHVPTTAKRGERIPIQVTTYGNSCVSLEDTEIELTEVGADITPYDRRRVGVNCPAILLEFLHETEVAFETSGQKDIRVNGRRKYLSGSEIMYQPVQQSFLITVE